MTDRRPLTDFSPEEIAALSEEEAGRLSDELTPIDISGTTAEEAAKLMYRFLLLSARALDYNALEEVWLKSPDQSERGVWETAWESGPYEWAVWLTGGASIYAGEFGHHGTPQVTGFYDEPSWLAEPTWSFALAFYPEQE